MIARPVAISFLLLATLFLTGGIFPATLAKADLPVEQAARASGLPADAIPVTGELGMASIYAFEPEKTANGETARPHDMTAAHRTLPFGTRVRVTNLYNGRWIEVRINDRGPFIEGRVIDLTPSAAHGLGFSKTQGLAPVTVTVLD